jgi:nicotinate dehydrogenase subunit A
MTPLSLGRLIINISLQVNGKARSVDTEPDTPLLYVLRNDLELNSAKYGCGMTQCGACTVLVNGAARRSCVTPVGSIEGNDVVTLEGLGTLDKLHPLQQAFIDEQAAQCGYCISGFIMAAADLLNRNPHPREAEVRAALADNLCRCGTHNRIVRAVLRAAQQMGKGKSA